MGDHAQENQGKLTRQGHPGHTRGTWQTRRHSTINVPDTEHEAIDDFAFTSS